MTIIRSAPLDGSAGAWTAAQSIQVDSDTWAPSSILGGVVGRMEWVLDPLGQRGTVLRSQLGPDPGATYGNRSEINFPSEPVAVGSPICRWAKWSCMVPADTFIADDRYFVIAQIHDKPDGGDGGRWPNFILYAGAGELLVMLPKVNPPTDGDAGSRVAARYPLVRDKWMDIQLGINLSIEGGGWIELSIDGNLVLKEYTHGTAFDDLVGPWFKLGVYNIFHHSTPTAETIARAYYSACEHHEPPYAPGALSVMSLSA